ncbi:MAG TPA: Mut7-C RNAse domain-containing protein [Thermodesulfovibrionales bacterium]|nr:Mut7-C RNAse domain-containing protein [Thermodesulfovibrionales bacterium]
MNGEPSQEVHFIADAMLGRLARWLRLLGFDTLYYPHIRDSDLLKFALRDGRYILTRDTHFLGIKNVPTVTFIHSNEPLKQVKEVIGIFGLKEAMPGRCARCNGILREVGTKDSIRDEVPEYVFLNCSNFLKCRACGNVYWEGTHLRRFRTMLGGILRGGEDKGAAKK